MLLQIDYVDRASASEQPEGRRDRPRLELAVQIDDSGEDIGGCAASEAAPGSERARKRTSSAPFRRCLRHPRQGGFRVRFR